jgi:hypothetical protein
MNREKKRVSNSQLVWWTVKSFLGQGQSNNGAFHVTHFFSFSPGKKKTVSFFFCFFWHVKSPSLNYLTIWHRSIKKKKKGSWIFHFIRSKVDFHNQLFLIRNKKKKRKQTTLIIWIRNGEKSRNNYLRFCCCCCFFCVQVSSCQVVETETIFFLFHAV